MPTYEYACKACEHNFEIVQSFSEDALTTCPECEQDALRKVYNAAGIIFRGDGWHSKDYASSGAPSDAGSGDASDSTSSTPTQEKNGKKDGKKDGGSSAGSAAARPAAG